MSDSMYMHVHTPATAYLHVCSARVHAHVSHTQPVAHPLLQTPFSRISRINHSRDWLGDRLSQSRRQMWVWRKRRDSSRCLVSPIYCWLEGKSSLPPLIQNMAWCWWEANSLGYLLSPMQGSRKDGTQAGLGHLDCISRTSKSTADPRQGEVRPQGTLLGS